MTSQRWNTRVQLIFALALCGLGGRLSRARAVRVAHSRAGHGCARRKLRPGQPIGTTGCSWQSAKPHLIVTVSLFPLKDWDQMKAGRASRNRHHPGERARG